MISFNKNLGQLPACKTKVLVAGATGYLGRAVIKSLKRNNFWVRAIVRTSKQAEEIQNYVDEVCIGQVTDCKTLRGIFDSINIVISTIGITRQKDGFTYMDVDYGANKNILNEALRAKAKRFIYVSVYNAEKLLSSKMVYAKELFVKELQASSIESCVIRPTGFFSDMEEYIMDSVFLDRPIPLIECGRHKLNPISGNDLAEVIIQCMHSSPYEVSVGGPEVYSIVDLALLSYKIVGKKPKLLYIPAWVAKVIHRVLIVLTPVSFHGQVEFSLLAGLHDWVAPPTGKESIVTHFRKIAQKRIEKNAQRDKPR